MLKVLAVIAGLILYATPANAAGDPYMPNILTGWCPGGTGTDRAWNQKWCSGVDFPGGIFWQQVLRTDGTIRLACRMHKTDSLGTFKFTEGCGRSV